MKVAIIDDEENNQKLIREYIERFSEEHGICFEIDCYSDGVEITENYTPKYDILLMDIEMKQIDGMTAAKYIRRLDTDVVLIFITNHLKYAALGYSVNAQGYLVKPVSYFAFSEELSKAVNLVNVRQEKYVLLNINGENIRISQREILYAESMKHKLIIHTVSNEYSLFESLKNFEKMVGNGFIRCNSCYLVNLRHVTATKNGCAIVGGTELQISRSKYKSFLEALAAYYGGISDNA